MEQKTSKVKSLGETREFNGKNGPMYSIKVYMDNGDEGEIVKKTVGGIKPGDEITYTVEDTQYGKKIKLVQAEFGGGKKFTPRNNKFDYIGFSMAYAKDLVVADKVKIDQLLPTADKIFTWMIEKHQGVDK